MFPLLLAFVVSAEPDRPFAITVVDSATGRGVPLVELRTVHGTKHVTDSAGLVAFAEPEFRNTSVFFYVSGHGYEFPKDGFGFRGKAIEVTPGGSATVKIDRVNVAERMYRVTGAGIYRDSVQVGAKVPIEQPLLNGRVLGSDSVVNAIYRNQLYWFWGDTNRANYPLGNFHVPGATSDLPANGGLDPAIGVDLKYFLDADGFAKKTAEMPGKGPTWIMALAALPDATGQEQLLATFTKIEPPLKVYSRGLAVFDDEAKQFKKIKDVDLSAPIFPTGHVFRHGNHVYFASPYPLVRMPAKAEAFRDPSQWEAFTCLVDGKVDRDSAGKLRYSWKANAAPVGPKEEAALIRKKLLTTTEARYDLRDRDSGKSIQAHAGSVNWNAHRRRWVMIAVEQFGKTSNLGEVWYAESDEPTGPWRYAVKIVTHDRMSFYNPKQHPQFDAAGGKSIYFEGTYTHDFAGNPEITPRYEYNQVMYRLDLSDPRVALPRPVPGTDFAALDRKVPGSIALPGTEFFLMSNDKAGPATVPVYQFMSTTGERRFASADKLEGFERRPKAIGRAWAIR